METVVVIFGGRSAEHDVSIVTALASIIKPLELTKKYRVEAVYIAKDGSWHWGDILKDIRLFTSGKIQDYLRSSPGVEIRFDGGMTLSRPGGLTGRRKTRRIDVAFPAMHGTYGEDGDLMGLLDMAGIPYVGCGLSAAAIAMDKVLAKQVAAANDIPISKFLTFTKADLESKSEKVIIEIKEKLKYPLFVKPAHLGSSIGISRVTDDEALRNGLEVAIHYDDKIIVEEAVSNLIEVTLPIIGNDKLQSGLLEKPLTTAEDFFDFDTKYLQGGKKGKGYGGAKGSRGAAGAQGYSELPAKLPKTLYGQAEAIGLAVYATFGCSGIARVDMLIDSKAKKVYFNEVNPLPGSLYAHNWNRAGISNVALVERLIGFAKERHDKRQALATTFDTNYLQQF